eukprot:3427480-Pyramimonas_sp.AAC.1
MPARTHDKTIIRWQRSTKKRGNWKHACRIRKPRRHREQAQCEGEGGDTWKFSRKRAPSIAPDSPPSARAYPER